MIKIRRLYTLFIIMALCIFANAQTRYTSQSLLNTGKWVKIRVKNEGVYQLTKASLSSMGFSDPSKVKLYGYNVPILPETDLENFPDDLTEIPLYRKADGSMLFYSCGTTKWTMKETLPHTFTHKNNPYSTHIYYFLTESTTGSPLEMTKDNSSAPTRKLEAVPAHSIVESDEYSFLNAGRTFFEAYDFSTGNSKSYTIPLPGIVSTDVTVTVQFCAAGNSNSSLSINSNGNTLATLYFSKLAEYQYGDIKSSTFTWSNVVSDNPTLRLTHTRSSGVSGHLDYIRASYERSLSIGQSNYLSFNTPEDYSYSALITGTNESTCVWAIDSPNNVQLMSGNYSAGTYTAILPSSAGRRFVAVNANASFPSPETVGKINNQNLHAIDSIDFLIIVPANDKLTDQAKRLADAHTAKDGLRCAVVRADEIYNEYSAGTPDITAYRRLLKMLYDRAENESERPKNVLLFGNCLWDNRLITSSMKLKKQDDYLLCYESENSLWHTDSYVAEEYITLLADRKGVSPLKEKPDCGVGRIPVNTATEAKNVVDKLIRYINNEDFGSWMNTICLLADDGNANTHGNDAESVCKSTSTLYPDFRYKKIYWDSYERKQSATGNSFPDAYNEINKTMQDGALIMNYTGHGAAYCLSHEQVLKTKDFKNWKSHRLPLWLTAACDVVPFDMNTENLGVEAVLNKDGGAMGFIGTARTVYSSPNRTLNTNFMKRVLGKKSNGERYSIGEALAQAKSDILSNKTYFSKNDTINKTHFILIGDPAIVLPVPEYKLVIDKFNGKEANGVDSQTISAGDVVTLEGHITDNNGVALNDFCGLVSTTVFDNLETITCKDNDGSAADVDKAPLTYTDRTKNIFTGSDSIRSGKFTISFPVSLDINYSNENGEICLYAISDNKQITAHSKFNNFIVGGTSEEIETDTVGPQIELSLAGTIHPPYVCDTPTIEATLLDNSGINTTGSGIGHDIVAIIDGNESTTYTLNSYYQQSIGDYTSGSITFTIPSLSAGIHTLTFRAFDTFNNMSEQTIEFEVVDGYEEVLEIFDTAGMLVLKGDAYRSLPKGVYLKRIRIESSMGTIGEKTEKILITQ